MIAVTKASLMLLGGPTRADQIPTVCVVCGIAHIMSAS